VLGVEAPEWLRVVAPPPDIEGHAAALTFEPAGALEIGGRAATVVVRTSDPIQPIVHVAAVARIDGALEADPPTLLLRGGGEGRVRVRRRDGAPFAIAEVRAEGEGMAPAFDFSGEAATAQTIGVRLVDSEAPTGDSQSGEVDADSPISAARLWIEIRGDPARGEILRVPVVVMPYNERR
jgi:hypothetical protein